MAIAVFGSVRAERLVLGDARFVDLTGYLHLAAAATKPRDHAVVARVVAEIGRWELVPPAKMVSGESANNKKETRHDSDDNVLKTGFHHSIKNCPDHKTGNIHKKKHHANGWWLRADLVGASKPTEVHALHDLSKENRSTTPTHEHGAPASFAAGEEGGPPLADGDDVVGDDVEFVLCDDIGHRFFQIRGLEFLAFADAALGDDHGDGFAVDFRL